MQTQLNQQNKPAQKDGPSHDLGEFLRKQMDTLAKATDQALADSRMQAWLKLMAARPSYSSRNMLLVLFQDPDATHVGSSKYWTSLGRQLVFNAPKVWVQAPITRAKSGSFCHRKGDDEGDNNEDSSTHADGSAHASTRSRQTYSRPCFIDVPIYDVRHTTGAALPELPEWRSLAKSTELDGHLRAFAQGKGIKVKESAMGDGTQGLSMGGLISLDPNAGVKTFVHELIHEMLPHRGVWIPVAVREWQAEIGAYLVCVRFGIPALNSPTYLAGWTASGKQARKQFEIAAAPAREIIEFVEERMGLNANDADNAGIAGIAGIEACDAT